MDASIRTGEQLELMNKDSTRLVACSRCEPRLLIVHSEDDRGSRILVLLLVMH